MSVKNKARILCECMGLIVSGLPDDHPAKAVTLNALQNLAVAYFHGDRAILAALEDDIDKILSFLEKQLKS